ncbi:MAG TPA: DinB family protein [Thermoanaerobaculia bacterium]|nr:DinB family protein [Thermoanaerobaculia bacterium]
MQRPQPDEYAEQHARYVALVEGDDVLGALETQSAEVQRLFSNIDETRAAQRYAEGKWSVKEVIGHITDAERVLAYRALAIARGEQNPLPAFDENSYNENAKFDAWRIGDLAENFALVRRSTIVMLRNLPEEAWDRRGIANQFTVSTRGIAFTIAGHERHHMKVLREKYGLQP